MKAESFLETCQGDRSGVKVVIWEKDNGDRLDFEEGHRYKLAKFESRGNAELWSTVNSSIAKQTLTRCRIPSRQYLNFDQILATTTPKNVDFVGKVVGVQEDGKRVIVEDVARKCLKINFPFGVLVEGVGSVTHPGKIIGFSGVQVREAVAQKQANLFSSELSEFLADHHQMPKHLVASFDSTMSSDQSSMSDSTLISFGNDIWASHLLNNRRRATQELTSSKRPDNMIFHAEYLFNIMIFDDAGVSHKHL